MIRIITDSLCDLTMDYAKELNIDIMPLTVRFGEDDFKCGIDLTNEAFYDKLTNDSNNPSTAAVNPFEFEEIFKKYIDAGDEVDRKSTRLNSSHKHRSRMPSSA